MTDTIASTGDVEAALEQQGVLEGEASVEDVQQLLDDINADIVAHWGGHSDVIDEGHHEIVHEDRRTIVLADHGGHFWRNQFDAMDVPDHLRGVVSNVHHRLASAECDHLWSVSAPVVVRKPPAWQAGEEHVLREVARRTKDQGSVARAVDQFVTGVFGWSKSIWASLTGRNPSTLTRTTRDKNE